MKRWIAGVIGAVAILLGLGVAGSYSGALHPVGDSLAAFRWELSLLLAGAGAALWLLGGRRLAAVSVALALFACLPVAWQMRPVATDGGIRLYQKNVWVWNVEWQALLADIEAADPDLVTLQEVHQRHAPLVDALLQTHPVRVNCFGGVHVYSRLPIVAGTGFCGPEIELPVAAMQVEGPAGPVWVVSVHLHWPWPYAQAGHAAAIAELLAGLDGPVIFAGDFNMVPWGHSVRRLADAADAKRLGPLRQTHVIAGQPLARLRLDHVYVPEAWQGRVERRPLLGSDHFGQLAEFGPPPR